MKIIAVFLIAVAICDLILNMIDRRKVENKDVEKMAIKTTFLVTKRRGCIGLVEIDDLINDFLEENPDIEVIDIKFQSNVTDDGACYNDSALIVYKEKLND